MPVVLFVTLHGKKYPLEQKVKLKHLVLFGELLLNEVLRR